MQRSKRNITPTSARTELRAALAELDATRARTAPLQALRAWREAAARRYVRLPLSERAKPSKP